MDIFGRKKIAYLNEKLREKDRAVDILLKRIDWFEDKFEKMEYQERVRESFVTLLKEKIPVEQNARKAYTSDITLFYRKILKDKLSHMVSMQKEALTILGKTEKEYEFYRANINCLNLLDDWCVLMENEHLSNLEEARQSVENSVGMGEVAEIKSKYI